MIGRLAKSCYICDQLIEGFVVKLCLPVTENYEAFETVHSQVGATTTPFGVGLQTLRGLEIDRRDGRAQARWRRFLEE